MPKKILVVADMKGMAYNAEVKKFIRKKLGACLKSAVSLGENREIVLERIALDSGVNLEQVVYLGECVNDLGALLKVRARGGLAIVLNNSRDYMLNAAPIALRLSGVNSAWPIALVAAVFAKWWLRAVFQMVLLCESPQNICHLMLPREWEKEITAGLAKSNFKFNWTICPEGFRKAEEK